MTNRCLKIGCFAPIILIVLLIIALEINNNNIKNAELYFNNSISAILGLENIDAKYIDKKRTQLVDFEVYKLLDKDIKTFLEKPNKTIPDRENFERFDWTRASVDSLTTMIPFGNFRELKKYTDTIEKLYNDDSYYALHYKNMNHMILYLLDEKNKLIYITYYVIN